MCVYDSRTHEAEPTMFQVPAEGIGFGRSGGNLLHGFPVVHFRLAADEAPRIRVKTSELFLNCKKRPRVAYGRLDFLPVSNDAWIEQQLLYAFLGKSCHFVGIKLRESAAIAFTLVQDDRPAQSGLRPFENKELEMFAVIVDRDSLFPIMIFEHQRIAFADPPTSF